MFVMALPVVDNRPSACICSLLAVIGSFSRFIVTDHVRVLAFDCVTDKDREKLDDNANGDRKEPDGGAEKETTQETGDKSGDAPPFQRLSKAEKKKLRG